MRDVEAQVIHDMQNTATVLREAASQLHRNRETLPPGVVAHLTEMMDRRSEMLVHLLRDLSTAHLAENGELDLSLQAVSLPDDLSGPHRGTPARPRLVPDHRRRGGRCPGGRRPHADHPGPRQPGHQRPALRRTRRRGPCRARRCARRPHRDRRRGGHPRRPGRHLVRRLRARHQLPRPRRQRARPADRAAAVRGDERHHRVRRQGRDPLHRDLPGPSGADPGARPRRRGRSLGVLLAHRRRPRREHRRLRRQRPGRRRSGAGRRDPCAPRRPRGGR